jgi:uncharacterized protein YndB with AHSA1/START domain
MRPLRSHDQGFVAVPPDQVYEVLANPVSYPEWWPGAAATTEGVLLPFRRVRRAAVADRHRNRIGLHLVSPDEELEWYLEAFDDGTIVNAFLQIPGVGRRADRRIRRMRGAIRSGLVGLKRRLEVRA